MEEFTGHSASAGHVRRLAFLATLTPSPYYSLDILYIAKFKASVARVNYNLQPEEWPGAFLDRFGDHRFVFVAAQG